MLAPAPSEEHGAVLLVDIGMIRLYHRVVSEPVIIISSLDNRQLVTGWSGHGQEWSLLEH